MQHASEYRATVRGGARAARPTLVVHARLTNSPPTRVGFVVSKAVGNAVTRNRVKRRLRHLVANLLTDEPALMVVVRALPAAATDPERLGEDLVQAWRRCTSRLVPTAPPGQSAAIPPALGTLP